MNTTEEFDEGQITSFRIDTKRLIEDLMNEIENKVAKYVESTNEKLYIQFDEICDSIEHKISLIESEKDRTKETKQFERAKSNFDMSKVLIDPTLKKKVVLLYQTLLQLSMFVGKWADIIEKVLEAKQKCNQDVDKQISKNKNKLESIYNKSTSGKAQEQIRENIKNAEFDNVYDMIFKMRKTMDSDYNTLEKWLDDLSVECEKCVDLYKDNLQKIIDVQNFTDMSSVANELTSRLTTLGEEKSEKLEYLKSKLENTDLIELIGVDTDELPQSTDFEQTETFDYHQKLLNLIEAVITKYMIQGFNQIEVMREEIDEQLEGVYVQEKKTAKVFNKMLDELSELEDYATER